MKKGKVKSALENKKDKKLLKIKEYNKKKRKMFKKRRYEHLCKKWGNKCVYCGCNNIKLEIDHIIPKSCGGSNKISNLTLSCKKCNQAKGSKSIREFLMDRPNLLKRILYILKH